MNTCYIIGAGDVFEVNIIADDSDYIICADGGYKYKDILGRQPDMTLGDFDSLGHIPETDDKLIFPSEKDESDMLLCVEKGFEKGYKRFVILGGLGGERMDHSIANIQLLHYIASKSGIGFLLHKKIIFTCIHNSSVFFSENCKGYISVFSLSDESEGVTINNLKYETDNVSLYNLYPMGLSNEFTGEQAEISVKNGTLLISWSGEASDCRVK